MVYPYDTPAWGSGSFPAGWNPQQLLQQALTPQQGGMPVMPQAVRGGVTGRATDSLSSFTPSTLTQGQAPQQMPPGLLSNAGPSYYGPTHQALSQNLQSSLMKQAAVPGLLSQGLVNGNFPQWQQAGGLYNDITAPQHGYSRVDWTPNDPNTNAAAQMLAQAREANARWGTPIPPALEQQVAAQQQAAAFAQQQAAVQQMAAQQMQQQAPAQNPMALEFYTPGRGLSTMIQGGDGSAGGGAGADFGGDSDGGTGGGTGGTY